VAAAAFVATEGPPSLPPSLPGRQGQEGERDSWSSPVVAEKTPPHLPSCKRAGGRATLYMPVCFGVYDCGLSVIISLHVWWRYFFSRASFVQSFLFIKSSSRFPPSFVHPLLWERHGPWIVTRFKPPSPLISICVLAPHCLPHATSA